MRQTSNMLPRPSPGLACALVVSSSCLFACLDRAPPPTVPTSHIAVADIGRARPLETEPARRGVGDEIEVEWQGSWYAAVIREARGGEGDQGHWLIHYDGYGDEWDEVVGDDRIRERRTSHDDTPEPVRPGEQGDDESDP
jgi:hypothetical protein